MSDPTAEQLETRFDKLRSSAIAFEDKVYRSSSPKYATETDLITGEGSRLFGGRWNPKGIAVVYASLNPETAMAETLAHHRYYNLPIENAMPRTFVALQVQLQCVLDLSDGSIRQRLRVSEKDMLTVDWRQEMHANQEPITQRLGRAAHSTGFEGLLVPSAAEKNGRNLLVFPANLQSDSFLEVINPDKLDDD